MFEEQMYQDYLSRLAQARTLMLNELRIKQTAGDDNGTLSVLDAVCRRTIGVPLQLVRQTSPERLDELCRGQANFNLFLIAEVLLQDVVLSEKTGASAQALVSRLQAFCLLVHALEFLEPEQQGEYREKLDGLATQLKSASNDPYLLHKVDLYLSAKNSG